MAAITRGSPEQSYHTWCPAVVQIRRFSSRRVCGDDLTLEICLSAVFSSFKFCVSGLLICFIFSFVIYRLFLLQRSHVSDLSDFLIPDLPSYVSTSIITSDYRLDFLIRFVTFESDLRPSSFYFRLIFASIFPVIPYSSELIYCYYFPLQLFHSVV